MGAGSVSPSPGLVMSLVTFVASALIWAFFCALAAIVAGAALNEPVSVWKRVLIGAAVGVLFGLAFLYLLVSFVSAVGDLLTLLMPPQLERFALAMATTLLLTTATTLAAVAVGALVDRSVAAIRKCALVGVAFGLAAGVTNSTLRLVASGAVIPAIEAIGWNPASGAYWAALTVIQAVVDILLAIVFLRAIRARRNSGPSATSNGN